MMSGSGEQRMEMASEFYNERDLSAVVGSYFLRCES